jgi:hypothetical protein
VTLCSIRSWPALQRSGGDNRSRFSLTSPSISGCRFCSKCKKAARVSDGAVSVTGPGDVPNGYEGPVNVRSARACGSAISGLRLRHLSQGLP